MAEEIEAGAQKIKQARRCPVLALPYGIIIIVSLRLLYLIFARLCAG